MILNPRYRLLSQKTILAKHFLMLTILEMWRKVKTAELNCLKSCRKLVNYLTKNNISARMSALANFFFSLTS